MTQLDITFPQPLAEKYRPVAINDFLGLEKPKKVISKLAANPFPSAWLFVGPSGTGKTTMALALAAEMPAQLHHIPAKECCLEKVQEVCRECQYAPLQNNLWEAAQFHLVLVDEADQMSYPAQLALLSKLDATAFPPKTIFIFTCNSTENLEDRFLSRCHKLEFSSYGLSQEIANLLERIWTAESASDPQPNFLRIAKDSANNVRNALMHLETELIAA